MNKESIDAVQVAACVIIYNSEEQVLCNIDTYINQVDVLYVIDNSEVPNAKLVTAFQRIVNAEYYWMEHNKGVAAALNKAAQLAINSNRKYLLMMDDDSYMMENTVADMFDYINNQNGYGRIGTVTTQSDPNMRGTSAQPVWYAITSGSLLNLNAYCECGPFMEDLFIDGVDHEYSYRLKQFNYEVIVLNYIFMPHRMGTPEKVKIMNKVLYEWSSHSPLRSYYLVRNFLYILNKYKTLLPINVRREVYYGVVKACMLDLSLGTNKLLRVRYIRKAILDYRDNKLGKLSQLIN